MSNNPETEPEPKPEPAGGEGEQPVYDSAGTLRWSVGVEAPLRRGVTRLDSMNVVGPSGIRCNRPHRAGGPATLSGAANFKRGWRVGGR
ncbi:hypothetical protein BJ970_007593 [Saccharopolyspora phatthalungensis]|uniref:Uncharacterized protein n=1 Tax=Saccharopolyspora phatthalungensis TaxID=664693 RepID=A0A840QBS2_9PSEU|nr:hypothetical protein [Saccharopolyspora phatthalungensis]